MAHTPGPWKYDEVWSLIHGPQGEEICALHAATINGKSNRVNRNVVYANASLISSAPDLLAACEALLRAHTKDARMDATLQIEFAVRKAKGA